jgi:hypothetical protein
MALIQRRSNGKETIMIDEKEKLKQELGTLKWKQDEIEERLNYLEANTDQYYALPVVFFTQSRDDAELLLESLEISAWPWRAKYSEGDDVKVSSESDFERAARCTMLHSALLHFNMWHAYGSMKSNSDFEELAHALSHICEGFRYLGEFPDDIQELVDLIHKGISKLSEKASDAID